MRTCPHCRSAKMIAIVYGLPSAEALARAVRKEVRLGGCMMSADSPAYHCSSCGQDSGTNEALQALRKHERSAEETAALQRKVEATAREKEERRRILKERARRK